MGQSSNISRRRQSALQEGSADYLAKRAELVEIAGRQFKAHGFKATTLAEIGHKAGLDRATVYYYFGSKEELFRECVRLGVDANIAQCEAIFADTSRPAAERLRAVIRQLAYPQGKPKGGSKHLLPKASGPPTNHHGGSPIRAGSDQTLDYQSQCAVRLCH